MLMLKFYPMILIFLELTITIISPVVYSLRFDLQSGTTKCITEDLMDRAMTVGKYSVANPDQGHPIPDTYKINVRVTSAHGSIYHHADRVASGSFAFTANEEGDYTACFSAPEHSPALMVAIEFEWKSGVAAKDWTNVAKKGQIEVMELELKKLFETVTSIHDEMFYLREREIEMQALNVATYSKMATFSFLSILVCLSVAALQLWHLKSFFEKKKLI